MIDELFSIEHADRTHLFDWPSFARLQDTAASIVKISLPHTVTDKMLFDCVSLKAQVTDMVQVEL